MTGGVRTLMSCKSFSDAKLSLLCFQVVRLRDSSHVMSFYALQVSFGRIFYAVAKKPDKLFCARQNEKTFAFVGK